jgi:hypothetical protein
MNYSTRKYQKKKADNGIERGLKKESQGISDTVYTRNPSFNMYKTIEPTWLSVQGTFDIVEPLPPPPPPNASVFFLFDQSPEP